MKQGLLICMCLAVVFVGAQNSSLDFSKDKKRYFQEKDWVRKAEMLEEFVHNELDFSESEMFQTELNKLRIYSKKSNNEFLMNYSNYLSIHYLVKKESFQESLKILNRLEKYFFTSSECRFMGFIHRYKGICLNGLARDFESLSEFEKSCKYFELCKNYTESTHSKTLGAVSLIKSKQYEKAKKIFDKAIPIMIQNKKYKTVFDYYNILSDMYSDMKDTNMVKYCNKMSYEFALKSKNLTTIALAQNNLAITRFYEGDIQESLELFNQALETRIKTGKKRLVCESYYNIASVYQEIKNYQQSEFYFLKSLELAKKNSLLMEEGDAYIALAQINKEIGNYKSANEFNENYIKVQEKIQIQNLKEMNTNSIISETENTFEFSENSSRTSWFKMYSSLFVLGMGYIVLIPILFRAYKNRQKANSV